MDFVRLHMLAEHIEMGSSTSFLVLVKMIAAWDLDIISSLRLWLITVQSADWKRKNMPSFTTNPLGFDKNILL
jgi:hypothetical protein